MTAKQVSTGMIQQWTTRFLSCWATNYLKGRHRPSSAFWKMQDISLEWGNINAATDKLTTFIKKVEKERGKSMTNEQADALISAANRILATL